MLGTDDIEGVNDVCTAVVATGVFGSGVGEDSVSLKMNVVVDVANELGKIVGVVRRVKPVSLPDVAEEKIENADSASDVDVKIND